MRLVALDAQASRHGLSVGLTVSDARAQVPQLEVREIDRDALEASFADFADWHSYASPLVCVLSDVAPYGDLCLDITGVSHLFGGEAQMLLRLTSRLDALGYAAVGAVAPTIGAAWALAHCSRPGVMDGSIEAALAELPVGALRLGEDEVNSLRILGLKQIGQLYRRDRRSLKSRFGESVLLRLDQALGSIGERMTPRLPPIAQFVERRFADPIGLLDDVLMCARDLAVSLAHRLEAAGMGAKTFHLFLYRVDHKVMCLSVNAGWATRDPDHIARLFAYRAERLAGEYDAGFGIDMIRLAASSVFAVDPVQMGAFDAGDGTQMLERLYDRMTSRLGPLAVLRSQFVDTHIPEQAVRLAPVIASENEKGAGPPSDLPPRPLRLLPQPEPVNVIAEVPDGPPARMVWRRVAYRFAKASAPERIAPEWWRSPQKLALTAGHSALTGASTEQSYKEGEGTRDYFVVEDDGGRRFWLFRLGLFGAEASPRWFLHGFFA